MPFLNESPYKAPVWLPGCHAQTVFPSLFRRLPDIAMKRHRFTTPDQDILNLDFYLPGESRSDTVAILSHGLEGDSRRAYMMGMALALAGLGWDCICRNFRCCGGEINQGPLMYHSGDTNDLHSVVEFAIRQGYGRVVLVGFSMGGNQVLKYLGEFPHRVPKEVRAAAVFSVPCDLTGAARELDRPKNRIYMRYFMKSLREKVRLKHRRYPEYYPLAGLERITTFAEFDNRYTAPVHGFASAKDYWRRASSLPFLGKIRIPTLMVNARNDSFLSGACFPVKLADQSANFHLETPAGGGHVGFTSPCGEKIYWSESRAAAFLSQHVAAVGENAPDPF